MSDTEFEQYRVRLASLLFSLNNDSTPYLSSEEKMEYFLFNQDMSSAGSLTYTAWIAEFQPRISLLEKLLDRPNVSSFIEREAFEILIWFGVSRDNSFSNSDLEANRQRLLRFLLSLNYDSTPYLNLAQKQEYFQLYTEINNAPATNLDEWQKQYRNRVARLLGNLIENRDVPDDIELEAFMLFQEITGSAPPSSPLGSESGTTSVPPTTEATSKGNYSSADTLTNMSFTGADAVATIVIPIVGEDGGIVSDGEVIELGEVQTISYSIHRENAPVRTLGHVNARGFIKGGRTIAGSLIFTVFNEYAFYRIRQFQQFLGRKNGFFAPLADMLPPFDIVLSFFNEYGQSGKMKIFGVTIIDEGQSVSIDDLIIEQTYTFMARGIQPLVKMTSPQMNSTRDPDLVERDINISKNVFGDERVTALALLYSLNMVDQFIKP